MTKILGKVERGKGKGRMLSFPTVNIELQEKIESGVYAGIASVGEEKYKAAVFVAPNGKLLEAYLIGFSGDLYGIEIEIEIDIGGRVRDVINFENDDKLKEQIAKDIKLIKFQSANRKT